MAKVFRTPIQANVQNFGSASSYAGFSSASTASYSFYAGAQNTSGSTAQFSVTPAGTLVSNSASISGVVTFTSGTLGPFTVSSSALSSSSGIFSASTASFANINLTNTSSATVPLTIVAASGQTANLTEWRNSSGTIVSRMINDGSLLISNRLYTPAITNPTSGTNSLLQMLTGGTLITTGITSNVALVVQNTNASATANLQQWQNSSSSVLASISASGKGSFTDIQSVSGNLNILDSAGTQSIVVRTTDVQFPRRNYITTNDALALTVNGTTNLTADIASRIVVIAKGASSQTADLQQWQNSSGTILSKVKSDGTMQIGTETVSTREYVQSRGMNLIANGTGALGTNYNFTSASILFTDVPAGTKLVYYAASGVQGATINDELIPVDPSKTYRGTISVKQLGTASNSQFYAYAVPYDIDGGSISPYFNNVVPSTQTTLAQNLNVGDTVIYLTSTTNWTTTNGFFAIYGYRNSYGYQYPDYTYTRSTQQISSITASNNSVTLLAAWSGASAAAGRAVANTQSAGTYKYFIAGAVVPSSSSWTTYVGEIGGTSNAWEATKFPVATAYIRIGWLSNYSFSTASSFMAVGGISLSEVSTGNLRVFDAKLTGDYSSSWFQVKDSSRLSVPTLNVDLTNSRVGINISSPSATLHSVAYSSTEIPLIVKGATSQTANLQQWQNSSGSVLANITASGGANFASASINGQSLTPAQVSANIYLAYNFI